MLVPEEDLIEDVKGKRERERTVLELLATYYTCERIGEGGEVCYTSVMIKLSCTCLPCSLKWGAFRINEPGRFMAARLD